MRARTNQQEELFIIARFHARKGQEDTVAATLRTEVRASWNDPGCLRHEAYHSIRDPRLFFIHSHRVDEAAFETHIRLPHTAEFAETIQALIDHELEPVRLKLV